MVTFIKTAIVSATVMQFVVEHGKNRTLIPLSCCEFSFTDDGVSINRLISAKNKEAMPKHWKLFFIAVLFAVMSTG